MKTAIDKDISKQYVKAAEHYNNNIESNINVSIDDYINLAFIYWQFAFDKFSFCDPYDIPDTWSIIGGNNYQRILDLGMKFFPHNVELQFWNKYFKHIIFSESFTLEECEELFNKEPSSLVLCFFLCQYNENKYDKEIRKLLKECIKFPTAKHDYIIAIIANYL